MCNTVYTSGRGTVCSAVYTVVCSTTLYTAASKFQWSAVQLNAGPIWFGHRCLSLKSATTKRRHVLTPHCTAHSSLHITHYAHSRRTLYSDTLHWLGGRRRFDVSHTTLHYSLYNSLYYTLYNNAAVQCSKNCSALKCILHSAHCTFLKIATITLHYTTQQCRAVHSSAVH